MVTKETSRLQSERHAEISTRQIGQGSMIVTLDSTRLLPANWTGTLTLALDRTDGKVHMLVGFVNGARQTFRSCRVRQKKIGKHGQYSLPLR
jgi:hypothetical protein